MFQDTVQFGITTVPGIRNKLFGGDGIFLAELSGPGRVWLQSLPIDRLAHSLVPYLPQNEGGRPSLFNN
ncbi:MAG TPA: AIM24 family protein, partial [Kutzneria sp.]|nr:AIM24 family protein [Kutzneria sp.]